MNLDYSDYQKRRLADLKRDGFSHINANGGMVRLVDLNIAQPEIELVVVGLLGQQLKFFEDCNLLPLLFPGHVPPVGHPHYEVWFPGPEQYAVPTPDELALFAPGLGHSLCSLKVESQLAGFYQSPGVGPKRKKREILLNKWVDWMVIYKMPGIAYPPRGSAVRLGR